MPSAADSGRHTLLVVDDELDVIKSVQDLLRYDYRVLGATRAQDALEMLQFEDVHVVVSDQRMPEMTGVELLREVRERRPEIVRLLSTGYADTKAVIDAINEGHVYRYIAKPWEPDELQTVLRGAVDRYEMGAERRRLMEQLQEKNAELEKANADLRQANALKTAFIEVASHELRTPITILLGMTELAATMSDLPTPLPEWLDRMHRSSERLQHLVEQIISMLHAGQFQHRLDRKRANVSVLLAQAADDVRPFVEERKQTLVEDYPEWPNDMGTLTIDEAKIRDCINHLLLNAIKFTPDGGTITLYARRTGEGGSGGGAEIRVSDTGVGIDPAVLPHLFEPFFAGFDVAHHSSGRYEYKSKGIGLGMSVVKAFVELHGGTIDVQTAQNQGTTMTLRLPGYYVPPSAAAADDAADTDTHPFTNGF